ncbi:isopenicillin N synthase family dioxygenase [Flavisphingomonas formosensis]|uniref:isopenicillin N synthase family dioxygenase n=1 Tax=Flavisphingomonas formosensis TaxID=861534 RepID=UPI0018E03256|nr:isopenicillin N synthase family oxygenase [Sphingomonas formosensis]
MLPIVDISALAETDREARRSLAEALRAAGTGSGFFYLTGHGLDEAALGAVLDAARSLFSLDEAAKRRIANRGRPGAPGYARMGGRTTAGDLQAPLKEEYFLRREGGAEPNLWPDKLAGFRAVMLAHVEAMHDIAARVMRGMALSLNLPEDHFDAFCTDPIAALRLVRYAPEAEGAGPHNDFGALTLLLQDDVGGLQLFDRGRDRWIDVPPFRGALVVNVGDLFERWTNGLYHSSLHRVANLAGVERFSAPFFLTGAASQLIECLPGCVAPGEAPRHPPVTVADHLNARFAAQGF